MVAPVLQQPRRFGCHLPLALGRLAPLLHQGADRVDLLGYLVLLIVGGNTLGFQLQGALLQLFPLAASLPGLGDWCDQARFPPQLNCLLRRNAVYQLPVPAGALVGGVEYRALEKALTHRPASSRRACQPWTEQGVIMAIGLREDPPASVALASGTGNFAASLH